MKMRHPWLLAVIASIVMMMGVDAQAQVEPDEEEEPDGVEEVVDIDQDRTTIGPFLGYDFDEIDEGFIGVDARVYFHMFDFVPGLSLVFNPAFNYYFMTDGSMIQIDANGLLRLDLDVPVAPFGGLGMAFNRRTFADDADLSLTINPFIFGVDFELGDALGGFVQFRGTRHTQSVPEIEGEPATTMTFTTVAFMGGVHLRF